ncbi:hypothetical protein BGY98DRAFT_965570 [Russula aff. rugulosa BPL654]|nr:hypothetical protein BGY98DRAFT_965570 [Russula aff. rugulosa BPL654]
MGGISAAMQKCIALRMIASATCLVKLSLCLEPGSSKASKASNPTAPGLFGSESSGCIETHATIRTASGQLGAVFLSRGSSEESDQSSNFTEYDICSGPLQSPLWTMYRVSKVRNPRINR